MMYTRASASDYDAWKTEYENPGWGSDDLIPLLRKVCARDPTLVLLLYSVQFTPLMRL